MSQEPEAGDATKRAASAKSQTPSRPDAPGSARPPRPLMSDMTPPPGRRSIKPTGAVKTSRLLLLSSFAFGLTAVIYAFLSRNTQVERLRELVTGIKPGQTPETLDAVATTVFWGSVAALVVVVVIEALLLRVMLRRHPNARWAFLVFLLIHACVAILADAFVVTPGEDGVIYFRLLLIAQLVLASSGLVASVFPGTKAWFRGEYQPRSHPSA